MDRVRQTRPALKLVFFYSFPTLAILLLLIPLATGPSTKSWWITVDTTNYGLLEIGATGSCAKESGNVTAAAAADQCHGGGLGYRLSVADMERLSKIPGIFIWRLILALLLIPTIVTQYFVLIRINRYHVYFPRRTHWLWEAPLLDLVSISISLGAETGITGGLHSKTAVVHREPMFWLPLGSIFLIAIWLMGSIYFWRFTHKGIQSVASVDTRFHQKRNEEAEQKWQASEVKVNKPKEYGWFSEKASEEGPQRPSRIANPFIGRRRVSQWEGLGEDV